MRRLLFIVPFIFLFTACAAAPVETVTPSPTDVTPEQGNPATAPLPTSTTLAVESTDEPAASLPTGGIPIAGSPETGPDVQMPAYVEYTSGDLWLRLFSPMEDDIFSRPEIVVTGQAPVETVISLNEDIYLVGEDESFSIPVTLEEGPNLIELVASNVDGDEIELVLTIVYDE